MNLVEDTRRKDALAAIENAIGEHVSSDADRAELAVTVIESLAQSSFAVVRELNSLEGDLRDTFLDLIPDETLTHVRRGDLFNPMLIGYLESYRDVTLGTLDGVTLKKRVDEDYGPVYSVIHNGSEVTWVSLAQLFTEE